MILLGIIIFLTFTEAIHEGLKQRNLSQLSGIIEAVKLIGIAALIPFLIWYPYYDDYFKPNELWKFWSIFIPKYIIGYISFRYATFDIVYNLAAGNGILYVGNTKWSDKNIIKPFFNFAGPAMFAWSKIVLLVLGIGLLLGA